MSNPTLQVKAVIQGVAEDRQRYQVLNGLLAEQRLHIVGHKASELEAVNARIMALYQQLTQSSQQRYQLLDGLGLPANLSGMQSLIARLPDAHKQRISALWQTLQQLAADCHASNEANGALMHMQQEILVNLLNIGEPENWLYQQG